MGVSHRTHRFGALPLASFFALNLKIDRLSDQALNLEEDLRLMTSVQNMAIRCFHAYRVAPILASPTVPGMSAGVVAVQTPPEPRLDPS